MSDIFTCGIDVGSTASKAVILKNGTEIVGKSLVDVGTGTSGPERAIREVFENAGMKQEDMAYIMGTAGFASLDPTKPAVLSFVQYATVFALFALVGAAIQRAFSRNG